MPIAAQAGSAEVEKSADSDEKTESDDKTATTADADPLAALEAVNAQAKTESDAGRRDRAEEREADRQQIEGLF